MKTRKILIKGINIALLVAAMGLTQSCHDDFLDEELTTQRNTDYYKTDEGIQSLVIGGYYRMFAVPFAGEVMMTSMNSGTDEFVIGGDDSNGVWNNYTVAFQSRINAINSNTISMERQWDDTYLGIHIANQIIKYATESSSTSTAIKQTALGEGYFFRAYSYLRLVRQFGGVPLKTNVTTTVETEFTRATPQEIYDLIVADFTQAYNLLANTGAPAKITKDAAAHYLAKALLSRASEINDTWNSSTKQADLNQTVTLCDEVISRHALAANYSALWNFTAPNSANESLPELILSAQFTSDPGATAKNFMHVVFASKYDDLPMMKRDLTGMRPYSRLAPSYYTYENYDLVNDSRLWKSFRTKHRLNNASGSYYVKGDLGIMYVINDINDNTFAQRKYNNDPGILYTRTFTENGNPVTTTKTIPSVYVAHNASNQLLTLEPRFPSLSKHFDASRLGINETNGFRDEILARSAETYLIAAEAKIKLAAMGSGSYNDALTYINAVRDRASFKAGENRAAYVDGGAAFASSTASVPNDNSYMTENSYYESTHIATTTAATSLAVTNINALPTEDERVIARLGYSSDYDRMMCFLLNERSRELCGEFHRWEDLSRTKTLVKRVQAYNPTASANVQDKHLLRPIPQTFLDLVTSGGVPLSPAQKQAMQNPGY
ncbi:RagB/SusD family nutrient uptake outer membrane protein [Flavobacterium sp. Sd200]|uniref:RagB/SusD family nutrient uptake outer membrane protein n=1 Tax=Flavobacterium sp. Sd200 TaxID=2692211 RepID=UPI00136A73CB|nr:RagB/SusD family nutrient uptake outer membrane protein [Flavobacterium sp. Sd200]MXN90855.1 RagB/SusD family nutrient uptake outer membrane protein [Flavobacterium sp. Sd200]